MWTWVVMYPYPELLGSAVIRSIFGCMRMGRVYRRHEHLYLYACGRPRHGRIDTIIRRMLMPNIRIGFPILVSYTIVVVRVKGRQCFVTGHVPLGTGTMLVKRRSTAGGLIKMRVLARTLDKPRGACVNVCHRSLSSVPCAALALRQLHVYGQYRYSLVL